MAPHESDDDPDSDTLSRNVRLRMFEIRSLKWRLSARDANGRLVWPPTVLGRRKDAFADPYVYSDAPKIALPGRFYSLPTAKLTRMKEITIDSIKNDQCPLYVFPPGMEGHMWAVYIGQFCEDPLSVRKWIPLDAGWTLKYATVNDMSEIDPHRKLVDWNAISSLPPRLTSRNIYKDMIGTPQCLSATQNEEFQGKLRAIRDAQSSSQKCMWESMSADNFASKLESILFEESQPGATTRKVIFKDINIRESFIREAFAIDGGRVATESFERLGALGVRKMGENGDNMLTSRMINTGTELELGALGSTAEEIRRATTNQRKLEQLRLTSTELLAARQRKEMIHHLLECATKSEIIMEEEMLSRVKLMKSLRQAEQKMSAIQKFISAGETEIVEEVHSDAVKEIRNQEHTSNLMNLRKAVANQECCICDGELVGFSFSNGVGESSSSEKLRKRACFLPCMHANVCTTCSDKRWNEGPRECPVCRQQLTEKPRVIYL